MAQKLSAVLPYPLKYKVTAKSSAEITQVVKRPIMMIIAPVS